MDQTVIEDHKKMMIAEAIPLFESAGVTPDDVTYSFETKRTENDGIILEMTAYIKGVEYVTKSRKIEQLNG